MRVTASGEAEANFEVSAEVSFGITNNNPFFSRNLDYEFEFDFTARVELLAHLEVRLNIFGLIDVYGVFSNFGLGLEVSSEILDRCIADQCFVVGTFFILRMGSINDFGAAEVFSFLRFGPINFLPSMPTSFHYLTDGTWHRACIHRLEEIDIYYDLLGEWEGIYTGSDGGWFVQSATGPRGIHMLIFHDGFSYRVLANIYPIEGGLEGRISYYGNVTFDPDTGEFLMQGTTLTYNPGGLNWSFIILDGQIVDGVITGDSRQGTRILGPFTIYKLD